MKGDTTYDSEWQPTSDFAYKDGTMNKAFLNYIKKNEILNNLWNL